MNDLTPPEQLQGPGNALVPAGMAGAGVVKPGSGRRYRGESNEVRRAQRHQRFVEAALVAFARDGFHQVTVRGICAEAGLTERYFYESFSGMEELFRTVYVGISGQIRNSVLMALSTVSPEDLGRFSRTALRTFFEGIQQHPDWVPVLFKEALSVSRDMTHLALSTLNEFVELLITIGQPSFTRQAGLNVNAGLVSSGMVGGIMHMANRWAEEAFATPLEDVVDNAMLIFAGVLQAQEGR